MSRSVPPSRAAGWTIALAIAIAAWWINRRAPLLVAAPSCAGLGEGIARVAMRVAPHQSVGAIVRAIDVGADALAVVLVTRLATVASRSLAGGAAIGLACARLFAFAPVYAVTDSLAIAAAAATLLAAPRPASAPSVFRTLLPWLGVAAALAIAGFMPRTGCLVLPATPETTLRHLGSGLHAAFATISPVIIGLAILGVLTSALDASRPISPRWLLGFAAAAIVLASISIAPPVRLLAPVLVMVIAFSGVGLSAFRVALTTPPTWIRRAVEIAVVLCVACVHLPASAPPPIPVSSSALGVDALTRASFDHVRRALPAGAALVDDDALERLLAEESGTPWVGAAPETVRDETARGILVALPPAQEALVHEGFGVNPIDSVTPTGITGVSGLARVTPSGECASVHGAWRDASGLAGAMSIALVAPIPDARGPVVAYLTGDAPFAPAARGWPASAIRGWYVTTYDRSNPDQARALTTDMASDGVPGDQPIGEAPFVARLELWRVPDAPSILDVVLGGAPVTALVRAKNAADPAHVLLCPSAPVTIRPLRVDR